MTGRQAEIERKIELTIAADVKRLEIALARRVLHSGKLSAFLKTRSGPPVLWLPAQQTATTAPLFQRRLADLDAWKVSALCMGQALLLQVPFQGKFGANWRALEAPLLQLHLHLQQCDGGLANQASMCVSRQIVQD